VVSPIYCIQASLLLVARSLLLLLRGRFFLPCLGELLAAVVAAAAPGWGLQKKLYSSPPPLVSKISLAQIPLATLLGPPGRAQVFPYLSPGPLDLWWYAKTNKPLASRN
jgi:hypothetical protein